MQPSRVVLLDAILQGMGFAAFASTALTARLGGRAEVALSVVFVQGHGSDSVIVLVELQAVCQAVALGCLHLGEAC